MQTISQTLSAAVANVDRLDAEVLLAHVLNVERLYLMLHPQQILSAEDVAVFNGYTKRRIRREPVAYIIGYKEFFGRTFKVASSTLIPRPDTESVIELALAWLGDRIDTASINILDLGTGSGAIAITLALEVPSSKIVATDVSNEALDIARENAKMLDANIEFIASDWFSNVSQGSGFDLIISNPPYITEDATLMADVFDFEPHGALFAKDDGLKSYKDIARSARKFLKRDGCVIVEIGQGQASAVSEIFHSNNFICKEIRKDICNIERALLFSFVI